MKQVESVIMERMQRFSFLKLVDTTGFTGSMETRMKISQLLVWDWVMSRRILVVLST